VWIKLLPKNKSNWMNGSKRRSKTYFLKERTSYMSYKVLNAADVEQFVELGWVKVKEAFPRSNALQCQDFLWDKLKERGVDRNDRSTWQHPMMYVQEAYRSPEFDQCNTQRLADAIEDLIGKGRWADLSVYGKDETVATWGWWPVNFALGSEQPWSISARGWHWDGIHFRHFVDSPEQGLLCLCLFSEVGIHGGGTLVAEGSHKVVARFLEKHPEGLEAQPAIDKLNEEHPWLKELTTSSGDSKTDFLGIGDLSPEERKMKFMNWHTDENGFRLRVIETTGSPGDVILCHPFLYHTPSQNHSGVPRFMCNRTTPLNERMQLNRPHSNEYSPLELSVRSALGR
jgi:hypothetical protein